MVVGRIAIYAQMRQWRRTHASVVDVENTIKGTRPAEHRENKIITVNQYYVSGVEVGFTKYEIRASNTSKGIFYFLFTSFVLNTVTCESLPKWSIDVDRVVETRRGHVFVMKRVSNYFIVNFFVEYTREFGFGFTSETL